MKKTFAACLAAALVLGSVGGAVAQERGYQGQGNYDNRRGDQHRGKADHRNKKADHRNNKANRHGNRYGHAPNRVYRGQVHRYRYGWQNVPPAYEHRYRARPGYRYYRVGNDVVLVAIATGLVVSVLNNAIR